MSPTTTVDPPPFARELLRWRTARRVSQLELASRAGTTQRYVSFIERGRSVPGRAVVLRLRCAEGELRLLTTLTSFATAVDVTLAELHLEAFLPADAETAEVLRKRAGQRR